MKDTTGRFLTKALFVEYEDPNYPPKFTLKNEDDPSRGIRSLRRLYMHYEDPTEGKFAKEIFGSMAHWKKLCSAAFFRPHISQWREELYAKLQSEGVRLMREHAKTSAPAARWLAERGWLERTPGRGRPSQAQIDAAAQEQAEERAFLREAERAIEDDND